MIQPASWLQCIRCGNKTDLLRERTFRCGCGGLLDVEHDILPLGPDQWEQRFDGRLQRHTHPSGVWKFRELVMPSLQPSEVVSLSEGIVPIVPAGPRLRRYLGAEGIEAWLILEGKSPTGSFKDFGMTVLISVAKKAGVEIVVCASTGDTSASAAAYAAAAGMQCVVLLPKDQVTPEQILQVKLFGAKVIMVPGTFDDCMRILKDLVQDYGAYPANSINPCRIEGHQATLFQLAQFFDWRLPDWVAATVGNGSNVSSLGKARRRLESIGFPANHCHLLGCQSRSAEPLYQSWCKAGGRMPGGATITSWLDQYQALPVGDTIATASRIGNPASHPKVIREIITSDGGMTCVTEEMLRQATEVCASDGLFVCPQTGVALAGVRRAIECRWITPGQRVAVVSTADGLKFTSPFINTPGTIVEAIDCQTESVAALLAA